MDTENEFENLTFGVIEYFGLSKENSECGYCKSYRDAGNTYGLWAHYLDPQAYQWMMDRNFRRCGKYIYKPINQTICCPMYTIRCNAFEFRLKKSQKRVIKRFNNYIKHDTKPSKQSCQNLKIDQNINSEEKFLDDIVKSRKIEEKIIKPSTMNSQQTFENKNQKFNFSNEFKTLNKDSKKKLETEIFTHTTIKQTKRKFLRRQKLINKIIKRENCTENEARQKLYDKAQSRQNEKTLEDFLAEFRCNNSKHTFRTEIIPVTNYENTMDNNGYELFKKYQINVHKETEEELSYRNYERFLIKSPLTYIEMKKSLSNGEQGDNDSSQSLFQYGAFHQLYFLDDCLIAVGVIDILPSGISSVYLFYDIDYSFLNLGVYSALNEIALTRLYGKFLPNLKFYYMGFYIHQCMKMRYKAQYTPSYLLCSETYRWLPIQSCISKLSDKKYARFCDDSKVVDKEGQSIADGEIRLLYKHSNVPYSFYRSKQTSVLMRQNGTLNTITLKDEKVHEFARLVGKKCVRCLLYYMDDDEYINEED